MNANDRTFNAYTVRLEGRKTLRERVMDAANKNRQLAGRSWTMRDMQKVLRKNAADYNLRRVLRALVADCSLVVVGVDTEDERAYHYATLDVSEKLAAEAAEAATVEWERWDADRELAAATWADDGGASL